MSRAAARVAVLVIAAVAGVFVLGAGAALTVDSLAAWRRQSGDAARVAELLKRIQTDAKVAGELQAEYDRQRDAALSREARNGQRARLLVLAAAVFLLSVKGFVALRGGRIAVPRRVTAVYAASARDGESLGLPAVSSVAAGAPSTAGKAPAATTAVALPVAQQIDLTIVDEIVAREGRGSAAAIPILHALQGHYRYLPEVALRRVCELTEITPAQISGVATFYSQFRRTPVGEHLVTVCHGTACHVAGAGRISDELRRRLRIVPGEDTDAARQFTVQEVPCLGCCTLAPVVQVDGVTHGHHRADGVGELLERHEGTEARRHEGKERHEGTEARRHGGVGEIRIGLGSCCVANGSGNVFEALHAALADTGVEAAVKRVGCVGMCHQTPFIEVRAPGGGPKLYARVQPEQARAIVRRHFKARQLTRRAGNAVSQAIEVLRAGTPRQLGPAQAIELRDPPVAAFLGRQKHIATEHYGDLDPLGLDEYIARDGFVALERCRREALSAAQIVDQIKRSGLRGRGGAGFPTWCKWDKVRRAGSSAAKGDRHRAGDGGETQDAGLARSQSPFAADDGDTKYIICNGDEGDPGAFMDRMLMESYPYRIIEGVAIAALAVGAREAIFYIRAEYPLAVARITEAIRRCEERGILVSEKERAGRPRSPVLHVRVVQGAGAFVCGEETALIASLEGQRGMPSLRPPYPAEEGLWGRPTLVNNVETFAVVPWIMRHGPEEFAGLGTVTSKGTKVFALAGKIRRGGLIEVPMGITIREIVEDIGGGVKDEETPAGRKPRRFKAVQIGGPSGGCVPAELADTPVDFEALAGIGAIMGSGGLVVLDETDCMVDMARYFLSFTQNQSCGKCVPCRVGTKRMLEILDRLCAGAGRPDDLHALEELAGMISATSLCGLGKTAPNPVRTTLRYFHGEYEAHLAGRCPAGKCKALIRYEVTEACTGCTLCAQHCPAGAIELRPYERHEIQDDKCTRCDGCRIRCPEDAIRIV